jgi:GH24 family phage-related lysozyme (muramidase)
MSLRKKVAAGAAAVVIATATPFIAKWEGLETKAYRDIVGVPTVCYGETRGVKMGDTYTREQCIAMLQRGVTEFYTKLQPCMTNPTIPVGVQASMLELAYNVGTGAVCKSTMMRLANQGKFKEACNELGKWVKAGVRTVRGLENRRADSKVNLCMKGL